MKKYLIVVMGPPAAGKSTVVNAIVDELSVPLLCSEQITKDMYCKSDIWKHGPMHIMMPVYKRKLTGMLDENNIIICDGFPRSIEYLNMVKENFPGVTLLAYNLHVELDTAIKRINGYKNIGASTIEKRYEIYENETQPVLAKLKPLEFTNMFDLYDELAWQISNISKK